MRTLGVLPGRVDVTSKAMGRLARTVRRAAMEPNSLLPLGEWAVVLPITPDGELKGSPRIQIPGRHGVLAPPLIPFWWPSGGDSKN